MVQGFAHVYYCKLKHAVFRLRLTNSQFYQKLRFVHVLKWHFCWNRNSVITYCAEKTPTIPDWQRII